MTDDPLGELIANRLINLEVENGRLRAALSAIADCDCHAAETARTALAVGGDEHVPE